MTMTQETAEILGLQALAWLAGSEDLLPVFLGSTGASEADVHNGATDPEFLGGLLDFLMMDDAWVISFCDSISVSYDRMMQARQFLSGGEQVNWT